MGKISVMNRWPVAIYICVTFCKNTRQVEFDTKAGVNQRVNEASKESGQHSWLFCSAFDKVCVRSKDIFFEDRIKGLNSNLSFKKFKICLIISILLFF